MKFLIPIDGSDYSTNAAKVAGKMAVEQKDYDILLLHVVTDTGIERKKWRDEGAEGILSSIREILINLGCDESHIECIVEDGNAPETIVAIANQRDVDKIVMGTQGKTGFKKIMGSVTEKVLQTSERLVLVVPPNYNI
ncbi:MAG: universal stress protein [Methanosarcinaceae archaeon]|nr:universal stress protein [Methanosarcinaceae archaeon]MDF1533917.1 universal stress protein [Methanosarcinaceae archaeon]